MLSRASNSSGKAFSSLSKSKSLSIPTSPSIDPSSDQTILSSKSQGDTTSENNLPISIPEGSSPSHSRTSSISSVHSTAPNPRSTSHVSLPQPMKVKATHKNLKRLSLADQKYFLHSAASSQVGTPTTACASRPVSQQMDPIAVSTSKNKDQVIEKTSMEAWCGAVPILTETQRLTVQHHWYKSSCAGVVHPSALEALSKSEKVLEVATGNGV